MKKFLVQRKIYGEIYPSLMTENELLSYINMDDCHDEDYEIYDCESVFGEVRRLFYKGWQPLCLIEVVDEHGEVVLRGYGEDH